MTRLIVERDPVTGRFRKAQAYIRPSVTMVTREPFPFVLMLAGAFCIGFTLATLAVLS